MNNTLAIIVTPIIIGLLMLVPSMLLRGYVMPLNEALLFFTPAYLITLITLILLGIPTVKLLKRYNSLSLLNISIAGAMIGIIVYGLFAMALSELLGIKVELQDSLWGLLFGGIAAFIYGNISIAVK